MLYVELSHNATTRSTAIVEMTLFRAWCVSIGITKDTAYRLLQVSALLDGSSPRQQKILKELSPTLLFAVAKPSAPAELVEKVKNGEVTTNKAYQDLLKENQQLRTERDKARADQLSTAKDCNRLGLKVSQEKDRADKAEAREEEARKAAHEYHEKYEEAAAMRATLLDQQGAYIADIDGLKKQNTKLKQIYRDEYESRIAANLQRQKAEGERDRAEERAKNAEDALKSSPSLRWWTRKRWSVRPESFLPIWQMKKWTAGHTSRHTALRPT